MTELNIIGQGQWPRALQEGIDFPRNICSIVKIVTVQSVLSLVAVFDLQIQQMDIKMGFLHGDLEEEIYIQQLQGFVLKVLGEKLMNISFYCLNQAL